MRRYLIILWLIFNPSLHFQGGCKHEISMSKGELSSPHYPDYYPAKKVCRTITLESNATKTLGFSYSGMCVDFLHNTWPSDKAAVHRVWAGAAPGVRLWPHRGVWRPHHQPADHGQVLRLQAAPPPHRHREHHAPRVQVRRFSSEKGLDIENYFHL